MVNNWQDAIRFCIRVNNVALERFNRWLAEAEREGDAALEVVAKARIEERKMANRDLQEILDEYGEEE